MRLLLDQGCPLRAAELFRKIGWDAIHVREVGLASADDEIILRRAAQEDRIVVTFDANFHQILATTGVSKPSVVRMRIEGLSFEMFAALLQRELPLRSEALANGAVASINAHGLRIRSLPLPITTK